MQPIQTQGRRAYTREFWQDRFTNRTAPVWSRLGRVFTIEDKCTAREAMERHHVMSDYLETPALFTDPRTGETRESGLKTILREGDGGNLFHVATVAPSYEIIQPREIAAMLDETPRGGAGLSLTQRWPVESIGTQSENGGFFLTLNAGDYSINGDKMQKYFLITNGNDGSTALRIAIVHIRVFCWNTITAAIKGAQIAFTIPHRTNANKMLECYMQMISTLPMAQTATERALTALAAKKLTEEQIEVVLDKTFKTPPVPKTLSSFIAAQTEGATFSGDAMERFTEAQVRYERKIAAAALCRDKARELHGAFNEANHNAANTGWSIFNAVTELLDNQAGAGHKDTHLDSAAREVLFGDRARQRDAAYAAIAAL